MHRSDAQVLMGEGPIWRGAHRARGEGPIWPRGAHLARGEGPIWPLKALAIARDPSDMTCSRCHGHGYLGHGYLGHGYHGHGYLGHGPR